HAPSVTNDRIEIAIRESAGTLGQQAWRGYPRSDWALAVAGEAMTHGAEGAVERVAPGLEGGRDVGHFRPRSRLLRLRSAGPGIDELIGGRGVAAPEFGGPVALRPGDGDRSGGRVARH